MLLIIDTTSSECGRQLAEALSSGRPAGSIEYVNTTGMRISHCLGCNYCWLKTPGTCAVKDDYEPLLQKISNATQVWFISDTKYGFVSYQTKNIVDRFMPLVTMNLHFVKKQMRHIPRYSHNPDFGIIYLGDGNRAFLAQWCERLAINFSSKSLGVYPISQYREAITCMR